MSKTIGTFWIWMLLNSQKMNSTSLRMLFCTLLGKNKSNSLSLSNTNSTNELTNCESTNNSLQPTSNLKYKLWTALTTVIVFVSIIIIVIYSVGIISIPSASSTLLESSNENTSLESEEIGLGSTGCLQLNADCSSPLGEKNCCTGLECRIKVNKQKFSSGLKCLPIKETTNGKPVTGDCPLKHQIGQMLKPIDSGNEFDEYVTYYEKSKENYLKLSAYRGNPTKNYLLTVRELNSETRKQYAATVEKIGKNIYPLIIATDLEDFNGLSGVGGTFTLYLEDGSSKTIQPTSVEYEMRKGLSHIPLGIFSILVPYFHTMKAPNWRPPLKSFYGKLQETLSAAYLAEDLDPIAREDAIILLNITKTFLEKLLSSHITDGIHEFEKYTDEIFYHIEKNIRRSAELQVTALLPALTSWKEELGEKWEEVYAIIPSIWPVSAINPRFQVISKLMSPEQSKNQVFILENIGDSHSVRTILGKIIHDRTAAQLILGAKSRRHKELAFSLSSRQDLMSNDAADAIDTFCLKNSQYC